MKSVVTSHLEQMSAMQHATSVGHLHVHTMPVKWHLMSRKLLGDDSQCNLLLFTHYCSMGFWDCRAELLLLQFAMCLLIAIQPVFVYRIM